MTNYIFFERSNYFRTTDRERLEHMMADRAEVIDSEELPGYIALLGLPETSMLETPNYEEEEPEEGAFDFSGGGVIMQLQELVHPDDAIIVKHIGYEGMRYLIGTASIITRDDYSYISLEHAADTEAQKLLTDAQFTTRHDY